MVRKLGILFTALALAAGIVQPVPAGAVEPAGSDVDAVTPPPQLTDADGDGLAPSEVTLPLAPDASGRIGGVAALSGAPEMVILEDVPADTHLAVRSRNGGHWSNWSEVVANPDEAPDEAPGSADRAAPGIGPIWIGADSERFEVALLDGDVREVHLVALRTVDDPATAPVSYATATATATTSTTTSTSTTSTSTSTTAPSTTTTTTPTIQTATSSPATLTSGDSFIHPRSDWATSDMTWACTKPPQEASAVKVMVVHHTAGTNSYTQADVPGIIRGIWYYHVKSRGWCDVAYQFLADKFGGVWEGRQGGVTKAIIGGHTYGFNTGTTAVAQLGNYSSAATPSALTRGHAPAHRLEARLPRRRPQRRDHHHQSQWPDLQGRAQRR